MPRTLIIGLLVVGLVGSGTAVADTPTKPLRGTFTAQDVPLPPTSDCPVLFGGAVAGQASHLGVFSGPTVSCFFDVKVIVSPPFNPGGGPPYLVAQFTNEATWITANGDELEVEAAGVFVQSLADGTSGVRATSAVVGGTGRFAQATGEAKGRREGWAEFATFEGWIDYDAADASG